VLSIFLIVLVNGIVSIDSSQNGVNVPKFQMSSRLLVEANASMCDDIINVIAPPSTFGDENEFDVTNTVIIGGPGEDVITCNGMMINLICGDECNGM
jgi:hypothetical protein